MIVKRNSNIHKITWLLQVMLLFSLTLLLFGCSDAVNTTKEDADTSTALPLTSALVTTEAKSLENPDAWKEQLGGDFESAYQEDGKYWTILSFSTYHQRDAFHNDRVSDREAYRGKRNEKSCLYVPLTEEELRAFTTETSILSIELLLSDAAWTRKLEEYPLPDDPKKYENQDGKWGICIRLSVLPSYTADQIDAAVSSFIESYVDDASDITYRSEGSSFFYLLADADEIEKYAKLYMVQEISFLKIMVNY